MAVVKEKTKIAKALENPLSRVTVDGQTTTWRGTEELIRADQYNRGRDLDPFKVIRRYARKATH